VPNQLRWRAQQEITEPYASGFAGSPPKSPPVDMSPKFETRPRRGGTRNQRFNSVHPFMGEDFVQQPPSVDEIRALRSYGIRSHKHVINLKM
jgi:hypothetical protein